jgi:hypothetical protein
MKIRATKWLAALAFVAILSQWTARAGATYPAPYDNPWSDFQIMMWQPQSLAQYRALRDIGVTGGMVETIHDARNMPDGAQIGRLLQAHLPWYVENIATDFYSPYHRWYGPDRPVNWRFTELKDRLLQNPDDRSVFFRDPSLADWRWLTRIRQRIMRSVASQRGFRPLYYALGDEPGIAETAAFWDFDLSAPSLTAMRAWLRRRYGTLDALDAEWGARFTRWDQVTPTLTRAAMRRADENFSSWSDFKEWMDVSFARALRAGTDAVHAADPHAVATLEGGQIPGWGGYDYARLVGAVDAMELYDYGNNIDIVHSLSPSTIVLTTSFGGGAEEQHRVWRQLLHGMRGMVLWDEKGEFVNPDGSLGPRGAQAQGYYREIRDGLGALLINAAPARPPVAILYSPASFRIQWMLDHREAGDAWIKRDAGAEYEDNAIRSAIRDYARISAHMGIAPGYISSAELARKDIARDRARVLILPDALALGASAARHIHRFVEHGGIAISIGTPGAFDEQGKRRAQASPLADLFPCAPGGAPVEVKRGTGEAICVGQNSSGIAGILGSAFAAAGVAPPVTIRAADGGAVTDIVATHFHTGTVDIIGVMRDLTPPAPGERSGHVQPDSERVVLTLPRPRFAYDLRRHEALGLIASRTLDVPPDAPILLALSDSFLAPPRANLPRKLKLGAAATLALSRSSPAGALVLHVDVRDPAGALKHDYSGTVVARGSHATRRIELAPGEPPGRWTVTVTDPLSGGTIVSGIEVLR